MLPWFHPTHAWSGHCLPRCSTKAGNTLNDYFGSQWPCINVGGEERYEHLNLNFDSSYHLAEQ